MNTENFSDILLKGKFYEITNNNITKNIVSDDFINTFSKLLHGSYYSPLYSVFHNEIVENAIKSDMWLNIKYDTQQDFAGYNFNELLINIDPTSDTFIVIRKLNEIYQSKGYSLIVNNSIKNFVDYLNTII